MHKYLKFKLTFAIHTVWILPIYFTLIEYSRFYFGYLDEPVHHVRQLSRHDATQVPLHPV